VRARVCMHARMRKRVHVCLHVCTHLLSRKHACVCIFVQMLMPVSYVLVHARVHVCVPEAIRFPKVNNARYASKGTPCISVLT